MRRRRRNRLQQAAPATAQPADPQAQPAAAATPSNAIPVPETVAAPTTMDQVVNLFIQREHGLIKVLSTRTPVVETYLQNLTADPQLGPVPSGDHYFLGRLDMGETVDRKDYLKEKKTGACSPRLLGGFQKLYKVQYQPMGFSWMVYADRTDFDREHYEFPLRPPRISGRRALPGVRRDPESEIRPRPLPGPHLGGRSGLQHRAPERNLRSGAAQLHTSFTWTAGA